ncbi:hypothetical protein ACTU3I_13010 [Microbacterium sp. RD1]|uniref:hypothetical protein n=1 Tax=Microbacterium sp. RD1 TaxID=3457313 RepID=UPI003FA56A55
MAFDETHVDSDVDTRVRDSFNTTTTNTASLAADVDNVGNTDNSTNGSGNALFEADGSFHNGSHNTSTSTDDSGNTDSFNSSVDLSDNSTDDHSNSSTNDNSINAGNREYNTGFGNIGGGGGGAGSVSASANVVDQSLNSNIVAGGGVSQFVSTSAVVGSGGAMVAGDDIDVEYNLDGSTHIAAGGDVLIDSDKSVESAVGSYNTSNVDVSSVDNSQDWDIENVGNSYSHTLEIDNSFNDEFTSTSTDTWDVDANVIWDSDVAVVADDVDVDLDL